MKLLTRPDISYLRQHLTTALEQLEIFEEHLTPGRSPVDLLGDLDDATLTLLHIKGQLDELRLR